MPAHEVVVVLINKLQIWLRSLASIISESTLGQFLALVICLQSSVASQENADFDLEIRELSKKSFTSILALLMDVNGRFLLFKYVRKYLCVDWPSSCTSR